MSLFRRMMQLVRLMRRVEWMCCWREIRTQDGCYCPLVLAAKILDDGRTPNLTNSNFPIAGYRLGFSAKEANEIADASDGLMFQTQLRRILLKAAKLKEEEVCRVRRKNWFNKRAVGIVEEGWDFTTDTPVG